MDTYLRDTTDLPSSDIATEFVDTFYSYHEPGSYYETNAGTLSVDDAVDIIDLYSDSHPLTPSGLSSSDAMPGLEDEDSDDSSEASDNSTTLIHLEQKLSDALSKIAAQDHKSRSSSPGDSEYPRMTEEHSSQNLYDAPHFPQHEN